MLLVRLIRHFRHAPSCICNRREAPGDGRGATGDGRQAPLVSRGTVRPATSVSVATRVANAGTSVTDVAGEAHPPLPSRPVLHLHRGTGTRPRATGTRRRATGTRQQATGDGRKATGDGQKATGNRHRATATERQATGNEQQAHAQRRAPARRGPFFLAEEAMRPRGRTAARS